MTTAVRAGRGRLAGRVAIVTGAGSAGVGIGVGRAIAVLFAREGASVCLVDRDPGRAEETLEMIRRSGGEAFAAAADVTDGADCARVIEQTMRRYRRLDVVVNNVGVTGGSTAPLQESQFDRVMAVNLKSAVLMCDRAVPHIGRGGAIVNITSIAGILASGASAYGLSKAAMIQLTRELAVAHGRRGIRVNAIAPGHIVTPLVGGLVPGQTERRRLIAPLGIEGDAWDVGWAAVFLSGEEARFVTGICLAVDGGATITMPLRAIALLDEPELPSAW